MTKASQRRRKMENRNSKSEIQNWTIVQEKRKGGSEKKKTSNKEIENEEKETEKEKEDRSVDAIARKVPDREQERNEDSFAARFLADGVERTGRDIA